MNYTFSDLTASIAIQNRRGKSWAPAMIQAVKRQMTLEAEAQRDDWHGQVIPRVGPAWLNAREIFK